MSIQIIPQAPTIFGRIGKGAGRALSEQLPKEVERHRLSKGLENISKESKQLSPFERYSRLLTQPGLTAQGLEGASQLLRQEAQANAINLGNQQNKPVAFPEVKKPPQEANSNIPSLTQEIPFEKAQEGYIPPTQDEIYADAGRRYNENPALFNNDPSKAIEAAENAALREEKIQEAYQKKHTNLQTIQDNVVERLRTHAGKLGVTIPENVYTDIEDRAIQSTKPKSQGGKGLTEQQAVKDTGKELDKISREYGALKGIGNWGITGRKASETLGSLRSIQEKFKKRNDTENLADTLISESSISPMFAYSIADRVSDIPELNKELKKIPNLNIDISFKRGFPEATYISGETSKISPKLANIIRKGNGSPLAVAYELQKKNYDPREFLDYVNDHRDELELTEAQGRQLDKPNSYLGTMNDWWLSEWSGIK